MLKVINAAKINARLIKIHRSRNYSKWSYRHNLGVEPLRPLTIGQQLEESASKFGHRDAIVCRSQNNKRVNFREVLVQADKLAAGLKSLGLRKGDRLGLWAPNLSEWYLTFMAAARLGLILVAINPAYQPNELLYSINKVGVKALIMADEFKTQNYYEILTKVVPELEQSEPGKLKSTKSPTLETVIRIDDGNSPKGVFSFSEVLEDLSTTELIDSIKKNQRDISPDDPFNIQFTSGTTGFPKAALTSHFHQVNNAYFLGKRNELHLKHQILCVQVPLFHAYGTTITTMSGLCYGATMVFPAPGFDPDKSLDAIRDEKCTIIHGTPTMFVDLVHRQEVRNEDISPEIAVSGGALCAPHLFNQMLNILKVKKVKSVYGLTETTAVVFQSEFDDDEEKSTTSVGKVGEHVEVKVVDSEGRIVPIGTPGELCVRAYCNMLGYWGDEAKTKETLSEDRWLKTGDQFILTEDGYGKVVGRLKEMIVRGGENIFPKEIEEFLNTHPDILETHVVGVPHERLGEEVCACVRLKPGKSLTHSEIKQFCKGQIAHFKIPSQFKVIQDIPKTASGKIQKFKLVEIVKNGR